VNEHRDCKIQDNERIEFLGDAVLELTVSRYLFDHYPELPEGKLTKLRATIVCEASLSLFAKEYGFDKYIRLGRGEERMNGRNRPALLCDLYESFIGALYLDQGIDNLGDNSKMDIKASDKNGYSNIYIKRDNKPISFGVNYNDLGQHDTSRHRLRYFLNTHNIFGLNESLDFSYQNKLQRQYKERDTKNFYCIGIFIFIV